MVLWQMIQNIKNVINKFENTQGEQLEVNEVYDKFCKCILNEMDKYLNYKSQSSISQKKFKYHKPFWNQELTQLWKNMCQKEKKFGSFVGTKQTKNEIRNEFLASRKLFEKRLTYFECQFDNRFIENLETINTTNPREFWKTIKRLGPRKLKIPMTVYDEQGRECNDNDYVLNKWKNEFELLYTKVNNISENNSEYTDMLNHKQTLESEPDTNDFLNNVITFDEVESVVKMAKTNKACGYDQIYNDILDNMDCKLTLTTLFNACFAYSKIPECWLKAIITPIP